MAAAKRSSESYAKELADLLCRYEDVKTRWRTQDDVWHQIRVRLAQYRLAKKREEKEAKRALWTSKITATKKRSSDG